MTRLRVVESRAARSWRTIAAAGAILAPLALLGATGERLPADPAPAAGQAPGAGPDHAPASSAPNPSNPPNEDERLRLLRRDIATLKRGVENLSTEEKGLLGDLKALEADVLQKQADLAQAEARLHDAEADAARTEARAVQLAASVEEMKDAVAHRLRALYRLGPPRYLRVLLASSHPEDLLSAFRAAISLSSRDAEIITRYRIESRLARAEALRLETIRGTLVREQAARQRAHQEAAAAVERKRALLVSIRGDRRTHESALGEMETAERAFGNALSGLASGAQEEVPRIAFERFRGLLDWPAEGVVSERFGTMTNPKFGTKLAHNGIDIDAPFGSAVRNVQDGIVIFSQWFRGYGLTAIIDHGGGWLSVYAHASALLVEKGEQVRRGQKIAVVGDSGSIRGPYLYFELRKDGRPVDPLGWLRAR